MMLLLTGFDILELWGNGHEVTCPCRVTYNNDCLFAGQVELENLPLKKDALKSLELPVEVKHGI